MPYVSSILRNIYQENNNSSLEELPEISNWWEEGEMMAECKHNWVVITWIDEITGCIVTDEYCTLCFDGTQEVSDAPR